MSQAMPHESENESVFRSDDPREDSAPATPPSTDPVPVLTDPPSKGDGDDVQ